MKINEVTDKQLDEGIFDNIKAGYQGYQQGGIKGAAAGYSAQQAVGQSAAIAKKVIPQAVQKYNDWAAQIVQAGQAVTPVQAVAWFLQFSGIKPTTTPKDTNPATIQQWLTKEIPAFIATKGQQQLPTYKMPGEGTEVTTQDGNKYTWKGAQWVDAKGKMVGKDSPAGQELTALAAKSKENLLDTPEQVVAALKKKYPTMINDIAATLLKQNASGPG